MKTNRKSVRPTEKFKIFEFDSYTCQYCGAKRSETIRIVIDHFYPVSRGGTNDLFNLITACESCNFGKSDDIIESNDYFEARLKRMKIVFANRKTKRPKRIPKRDRPCFILMAEVGKLEGMREIGSAYVHDMADKIIEKYGSLERACYVIRKTYSSKPKGYFKKCELVDLSTERLLVESYNNSYYTEIVSDTKDFPATDKNNTGNKRNMEELEKLWKKHYYILKDIAIRKKRCEELELELELFGTKESTHV